MPIEEVATQYKTSGGKTFPTKAEAKLHNAVEEAEAAFTKARRELGIALAATYKSAEGLPFELDFGRTYYYLHWYAAFGPRIGEVYFSYWDVSFDVSDTRFRITRRSWNGTDDKTEYFDPASLYLSYREAQKARLEAAEGYFREQEAHLLKLRAELAERR